jgi:hypothetical protein
MWERGEVDGARRAAARTGDLKPQIATIDRLIDRRRGIDRLAIGPNAFVPALACEIVGFSHESASPMARFSAARSARMVVFARDRASSFFSALRSPPESGVG